MTKENRFLRGRSLKRISFISDYNISLLWQDTAILQKLGQLLTGSCAAIAIGQILNPAITASVSQNYIDKDQPQQISVSSLWVGGFLTIFLSLLWGWVVSRLVYQWFTK